jgi:hypothetical protein
VRTRLPGLLEPVGRRRDRKPRHQPALVVVDPRRQAAHAELELLVVACDAVGAHRRELALQACQVGDAVAGVAGEAGARGVGAHTLRVVMGEEELADRGEVQRRPPADGAHHLHARALAERPLDVDDLVALAHREVHRLARQAVQLAHRRQRRIAHVEAGLDEVAELEQPHAEPVAARLRAIHEAADRQVVEDAMRRRRVQARALADLLQRHRLGLRRQRVEQREGSPQNLDRRGLRVFGGHMGGREH